MLSTLPSDKQIRLDTMPEEINELAQATNKRVALEGIDVEAMGGVKAAGPRR